jgi:hypothetical protein
LKKDADTAEPSSEFFLPLLFDEAFIKSQSHLTEATKAALPRLLLPFVVLSRWLVALFLSLVVSLVVDSGSVAK